MDELWSFHSLVTMGESHQLKIEQEAEPQETAHSVVVIT